MTSRYAAVEPDDAPDDAIRISQSAVESMRLCPGRVILSGREGYVKTPSEPMSWGSLLHSVLEADLLGAMTLMDLTDDALIQRWIDEAEPEGYNPLSMAGDDEEIIYGAVEEIRVAHDRWVENVRPTLAPPVAIEQQMSVQVADAPSGRTVYYQGTADYFGEDGVVIDWKSSGSPWKVNGDATHKGDKSVQMPWYAWLIPQVIPNIEPITRGGFWVWDRKGQEWAYHETLVSQARVDAAMSEARLVVEMIDAGIEWYTPGATIYGKTQRGWWCSAKYCGAWDVCPGKNYFSDEVDLSERITTDWR